MVTTIDDGDEIALEGTQISIFAADTLNTTSFSDTDGKYSILGLEAGMYRVLAEQENFISSDTIDVQINPANITIQDFELEADITEGTEKGGK